MARLVQLKAFETAGERRTAQHLKAELPEQWVVISGAMLIGFAGLSSEFDFIVVGDHGVYVINDKSFNGRVVAGRGDWAAEFGPVDNPVEKVEMAAKRAAGLLREGVPGLSAAVGDAFFLHAYICLSGQVELEVRDRDSTARVFLLNRLAQALLGFDRLPAKQALAVAEVRQEAVDYITAGRDGIAQPDSEGEEGTGLRGESPDVASASSTLPRNGRGIGTWIGLVLAGCLALGAAVALAGPIVTDASVSWQDAASYQGERVWVEGPVVGVRSGDGVTYLNVGRDWPDDGRLAVRIYAEDLSAFKSGVGSPEAAYDRKMIEVLGVPTASDDSEDPHTYVVVESPEQMRVVGRLGGHLLAYALSTSLVLGGLILIALGWRRRRRVRTLQ